MKHPNQRLNGPKKDLENTLSRLSPKERVEYYIDTAKMFGFTRKQAILQLHAMGVYLTNIPQSFLLS